PIILIARQPLVVGTHPSLDLHSLADLVALAKQKPGLTFASSGVGSNQHILGAWFTKSAGIRLDHVPYRGAGQAGSDLLPRHRPGGERPPRRPRADRHFGPDRAHAARQVRRLAHHRGVRREALAEP